MYLFIQINKFKVETRMKIGKSLCVAVSSSVFHSLYRFCDLVFQGPLSVQEDWIKHLQRHIMNTSVPHTGLSMVEVPSLPKDPQALKIDHDNFLTATHAAS